MTSGRNKPLAIVFDRSAKRFIAVGLFNTALGAAVMFALYNVAGCGYWISSAANYGAASAASFFLNKYYTFGNAQKSWRQCILFICNIVVCYVFAYAAAASLIETAFSFLGKATADNIALGLGLCLFTVCNYLGQRLVVFRQ